MMRTSRMSVAIAVAIFQSIIGLAEAGDASTGPDGVVTWQAGVDGIEIEWNPNGSVKRLSSKYSAPVEFTDRRGIYKAQVIAEEKAKAAVIRFIKQELASTRIVAEIQNDVNTATQQRRTGGSSQLTKTDTRTVAESLTEVTSSFASGTLSGVIILEKGYNEKTEEAWVVVGISDKTIRAAQGVRTMSNPNPTNSESLTPGGNGTITKQPGEIRRLNEKNW